MKKLFFLFLITFSFHFKSLAQKQGKALIDSLLTQLQQAKEDSNKVNLYIALISGHLYFHTVDGIQYEKPALELAQKLDLPTFFYRIKYYSGRLYWRLGKFNDALLIHFEALKLAEKAADKIYVCGILSTIGQDYVDQRMFEQALKYFNQSISVAKELNYKKGLARGYNLLSYTYSVQGKDPESFHYRYKELEIYEQQGDILEAAKTRLIISSYFESIGNDSIAMALKNKAIEEVLPLLEKSKDIFASINLNTIVGAKFLTENNFREALKHFEFAYKIAEENNDIGTLGNAYLNMGNVYEQMGDYTTAIKNYLLAVNNFVNVSANESAAMLYVNIGKCYTRLKKYTEARTYFDKAIDFAKKQGNETVETDYYRQVELLDSALGNWKNAYLNYKLFVRNNERRNNELNKVKVTRISMQYSYDIEQSAAKAEQERKEIRKRNIRNLITVAVAVLLIFLIVVFRQRYRLKQTKNLLELRNRIAGDLHDEIGSTLSSISLYGEVLKKMVQDDSAAKGMIIKINDSTNNMMEAISDIVWTINTKNDTLDEVISKIRTYAVQRMEVLGCEVHFNDFPLENHYSPDMIQRKNIYLLAKETINNAAKYSGCKNLYVEFSKTKHEIMLKISDDGKGFDPEQVKRGNGLFNMQQRAAVLKGSLSIKSIVGKGTEVMLIAPL